MGSLGAPEILVILVVALIVLGPNRLPEAARQVGKALAELRRMSAGFQAELRDAMEPRPDARDTAPPSYDDSPQPMVAPGEQAHVIEPPRPSEPSD